MSRYIRHVVGVATAAVALGGPRAGATPGLLRLQRAGGRAGLASPTAIAFLPDRRLLVTEKGGALKLVQGGSATTLTTIPVCTGSEMGLLGIAPDPNFDSQRLRLPLPHEAGRPAAAAARPGASTRSCASRCPATRSSAGSLTELLTGIRTDGGNHDGGTLRIGPDDKLWVSVGDTGIGDGGAPGQSTNPYSQDLSAPRGQDPAARAERQPRGGQPVHRPAARAARGLRARLPQPVPDELRRPDRTPVGGRRGPGHDRGDRHRPGRRATTRGRAARARCPPAASWPGDVDPVFEYPHSGAGALGPVDHRRRVPRRAASASSAASTSSATTRPASSTSPSPNAARNDIATPVDFVTDARRPGRHRLRARRGALLGRHQRGRGPADRPRLSAPEGCAPTRVSLVPAYQQCTAPEPHARPAARVPAPATRPCSAPRSSRGHARRKRRARQLHRRVRVRDRRPAIPIPRPTRRTSPLRVAITDVRRRSGLADYTGQLQASAGLRITDRDNAAAVGLVRRQPCRTARSPGRCRARHTPTRRSDPPARSRPRPTRSPPGWSRRACARSGSSARSQVFDGGPDGVASTTPNTPVRGAGRLRSLATRSRRRSPPRRAPLVPRRPRARAARMPRPGPSAPVPWRPSPRRRATAAHASMPRRERVAVHPAEVDLRQRATALVVCDRRRRAIRSVRALPRRARPVDPFTKRVARAPVRRPRARHRHARPAPIAEPDLHRPRQGPEPARGRRSPRAAAARRGGSPKWSEAPMLTAERSFPSTSKFRIRLAPRSVTMRPVAPCIGRRGDRARQDARVPRSCRSGLPVKK